MSIQGRQFQPVYKLTLFRDDGEGVLIEPPACIEFEVSLTRVGQPNEANITLYNLNESMKANISSNEYGLIRLETGYEAANNMAVIFEGDIRRAKVGKLRTGSFSDTQLLNNDFVTSITAGEGELSWRRVTIEHTFPAGTTFAEMVRFCIGFMPRITEGDLGGLDGWSVGAPYTVAGPLRHFFEDLSKTTNSRWSMQRTSLDFISNEQAKNTFTVNRKTYETGLYEATLDEKALDAAFALDPALKPNGVVEIGGTDNGTQGFWRINDVTHFGTISPFGGVWESQVTGQRLEGVERVTGQDERTEYAQ